MIPMKPLTFSPDTSLIRTLLTPKVRPIIIKIDEHMIPIRPKVIAPLFLDLKPRMIPVTPKMGGKNKREIDAHIIEETPSEKPGCLLGRSAGTLVAM